MKTYEIKRLSSSIFDLFYRLLSLLFWVLIIFGFDTPYVAILTLLSAAVHEVGHIAAILILSGDLRIPDSRVNGMRISLRMKSYTQEIIIAAAGPFANLFCAFILLMFPKSEYTTVFVVLNVFTVASNLLPTEGSDGYRIIKSIIDMRSASYSPFFLDFLSLLINVLISLFSLYLILRIGDGYWLYALFLIYTVKGLEKARLKAKNEKFKEKKRF